MPTPKLTFTLAVLFALATAWLLFFEPHFASTGERAVEERRVLHLHADQVRSLHLRRDAWTAGTIERIDASTFKRTEPLPGTVDSPAVAELLSSLEFHDHLAVLEGHGSDSSHLYDEGLTPPALAVTVTMVNGSTLDFDVGKETPTGDGVYLHVKDDTRVEVVAKALVGQLNHLLDQLAETGSDKAAGDAAPGADGRPSPPTAQKGDARSGD